MKFLQRYRFRWSLMIAVVALLGGLLLYESLGGVRIETDILASLPSHDPVLADAHRVIRHLPAQDRLIIDVAIQPGNGAELKTLPGETGESSRDALTAGADLIEAGLRESGLFRQVGTQQMEALFPELVDHIVGHLPLLFDGPQLEAEIAPLLAPAEVGRIMAENLKAVQGLEGIGQAGLIARDPLGFRNLVLPRISQLLPSRDAQLHRGKLISRDGEHLLIIAELKGSATDTTYTRAIPPLIETLGEKLNGQYRSRGIGFALTPVGAYRAALDNENAARRDMRRAIVLTTLGVAFLLVVTFPRPLVGLLALLPSTAGAIFALLLCSFLFPSLSILAVSFGGAIMAFSVDMAITYLLFLDRPCEVSGRQAAREVKAAEILAALTTIGGFLLLLFSKFGVLAEVGLFAALGVAITFSFVHWVFPMLFPVMPPALKSHNPWLSRFLDRIALSGGNGRLAAVALFFVFMLFFARPVFQVDINAMNSLSKESIAAEKEVQRVWGDLASRVYLMIEGRSLAELQDKSDQLAGMLREDLNRGRVQGAFLLSDLFPGKALAGRHAAEWQAFWTPVRAAGLRQEIDRTAREMGFAPGAFDPFVRSLADGPPIDTAVPERFAGFLGIAGEKDARVQVSMVTPGPDYDAEPFFARYAATKLASIFDAGLFVRRLGEVLVSMFTEIALITGLGIVLVVFAFFLDWRLSLIVLAPAAFALVSTLGTLKLLGHPVDIPGIMLWIVIMAMGIDYGIYYVCAYQRYLDERHPFLGLIRQAMFLAAATTLIGFGVLAGASHAVLRSIGLTSLLGIAYSFLAAFLIVPPLVKRVLVPVSLPAERLSPGSARHTERTRLRYRHISAFPRLFARLKMRLDPMFPRLAAFIKDPRRILDIGCGYGVPSVWLLELFPDATVCGLDPDGERVRVARSVVGSRGDIRTGRAPELADLPGGADTALILDVIHMLDDAAFQETLRLVREKLIPGGRLVIRVTIPADRSRSWMRRIEEFRLKFHHLHPHYRRQTAIEKMIVAAGFVIAAIERDTPAGDEWWFVADRDGSGLFSSGAGTAASPSGLLGEPE